MVLGTFWGTYHDLVASSAIGAAALIVAWAQARDGRLIDLHEKMTTGEVAASVHRLAAHLYEGGSSLVQWWVPSPA